MAQQTGIIFDIKEFAIFDGPGIRTTVFMKGCPLRCQWCHNPEGLLPEPQLMVSHSACIRCGACERICQYPGACVGCGRCIPVCRGGLRRIVGQVWTVDALVKRLRKDVDVYQATGGGVTFSGGEPLMQWDFIASVIKSLPGVSAAIETSGYASDEAFTSAMAACSLLLMDWKVSDPDLHRRYTGVEQTIIRRHAQMLVQGSTPFILRLPIIPGVNDNRAHFDSVADLVAGAKSLIRVDVLPYQRTAGAKYAMVGKAYMPDFNEDQQPQFFVECFERRNIPYQCF